MICLTTMSACSQPTESDVVGTYMAKGQQGIDVLQVNSNHTYDLEFLSGDGRKFTQHGAWRFELTGAKPTLTFDGFVFGYQRGSVAAGQPESWPAVIERTWNGRIRLPSPKPPYVYEKGIR